MYRLKRILVSVISIFLLVLTATPLDSFHGVLAEADDFDDDVAGLQFPMAQTFIISAYYSPLPCQNRYVTGSYDSDIRLNGRGTNGADGTPVYPGMIAAPRNYPFGTKMYIPDLGMVSVHDRGGAIVNAGVRNHAFDRLDVWMGYGDKGLRRALNWGKRTIDVTVYGVNDSIADQVTIGDYDPSEAVPNDCSNIEPSVDVDLAVAVEESIEPVAVEDIDLAVKLSSTLSRGVSNSKVLALQKHLKQLNFYKGPLDGVFDELTEHAVYKFQQSQDIVASVEEIGSGVFGPQTRDRLNEIISSRNYRNFLVAQKMTDSVLATNDQEEEVVQAASFTGDYSFFSDGF